MKKILLLTVVMALISGYGMTDDKRIPERADVIPLMSNAEPVVNKDFEIWKKIKTTQCMKETGLSENEIKALDATYSAFAGDPLCCAEMKTDDRIACLEKNYIALKASSDMLLIAYTDIKPLYQGPIALEDKGLLSCGGLETLCLLKIWESKNENELEIAVASADCKLKRLACTYKEYHSTLTGLLKFGCKKM